MPHHRAITAADTGSSRPVSPFRKQRSQAVPASRQDISISRTTSVPGGGGGVGGSGSALTPTSGRNTCSRPWWGPGSPRQRPVLQQGLLKKRGGRINTWAERYFILRDDVLEQYPKGEDGGSSEPKHFYDLDPSCSLSEIKEAKAGGRPLFYFALEWPPLSQCKEEGEGDGDSGRSGQEGYERDMSGPSNVPTPLDSPTEAPNKVSAGLDFGSEDGSLPLGPPRMERVDSVSSLTGHQGRRFRRPRCNSSNGGTASVTASPLVTGRTRESPGGGEDGDELKRNETLACQKRNETIESMMAAQRDNETRIARRKLEEVEQFLGRVAHPLTSRQRLTGYERGDKARRPEKKKKDGRVINSRSQAVAATAVGVSWLTAGIATGGLVIAGTLVAAGVTVGSMGVYNKYKNHKNPNGSPGRVRLASDKVETAEQWRNAILEQLALLRSQPRRELERSASLRQGLGLGIPWVTPPEGPPPALREIDLRAVDKLLSNATWASRGVMHGLPILQQEVGVCAVEGDGDGVPGEGEPCDAGGAATGWGLGGAGPVLKTQTIVRASPLETFVALIGAPKHSMTAVMSGTFTVEALDDHSDVIRWCLRPAWLKLAWASPRDFCLARYWHMAEDGCYIVTFASMVHPDCPVDPSFVRGEAHAVYTIAPRRDSVPGGHASPECLLTCHVQVDPKGWVWNRLGFRERYASHLLMTALEVRDVIEAERFMTPRINLRPDSPTGGEDNDGDRFGGGGAGQRCSADGKPLLFGSGLAAVGGESREGRSPMESACHALAMKNLTPLENCLPSTLDPRRWTEADGTDFMVRGASYLSTRVKVPSAKQMFRLRAVDLFLLPAPATHLASHPRNRVQLAREAGESTFVWVLQIMVPGPPHYSFVCYFTPGADNWLDQETPFGRLAKRVFFGDSDAFRDERLKLIPKIVEGNWVVKRAAGTTPAILGTKLKQHHFRGDNYLETDLEIASSSLAANITRLCTGYAKALVVDMVWTIQGNTEEELPEVALGGVRINHLDLITAQPLDPLAPA